MMRKSILIALALCLCITLPGQEYGSYVSFLHPKPLERDFPDVMRGLQITRNDSLILRTNAIFDIIRTSNEGSHKYNIGRIPLFVKGYDKDVFYGDEIWVALDEDFRLMFVFPAGTQNAYYNEEYDMFRYTTHCTSTYDFWYNFGLVNLDGSVVSPARYESFCVIVDGKVVTLFRKVEDNGETRKFIAQYKSLSDENDKISVTLKIPSELGETIFSAEDFDSPFYKEDPFNSAVIAFYDAEDMRKIAARFKKAAKTDDKLLSDCALYNAKAIKSALKSARKRK